MEGLPPVLIFGVLNFGMEDKLVLLPDTYLAIPLDYRNCKPGHIRESDYMKMYLPPVFGREPVPFFQLKSVNEGEKSIPRTRSWSPSQASTRGHLSSVVGHIHMGFHSI